MGAHVVHDGIVKFRFACRTCEVSGPEHDDAASAEQDGLSHEHAWHRREGWAGQGYWYCRDCDRSIGDGHAYDDAAAEQIGWQHELEWHHRVYVVEQIGTYDVDPPGAYEIEGGYCDEPESSTEAPLECAAD